MQRLSVKRGLAAISAVLARPILLAAAALVIAPIAAGAHAGPVAAAPPPAVGLPQAPGAVVLRFAEPLNHRMSRIEVVDPAGHPVVAGPTLPVEGDPHAMRRKLPLLAPGQYTLRWTTVSSLDGHVMLGGYTFGVATAARPGELVDNDPVSSGGWLGLAGRFTAVLGLALWAGGVAIGTVAVWAGLPRPWAVLIGHLGPGFAVAGTTMAVVSTRALESPAAENRPTGITLRIALWLLAGISGAFVFWLVQSVSGGQTIPEFIGQQIVTAGDYRLALAPAVG